MFPIIIYPGSEDISPNRHMRFGAAPAETLHVVPTVFWRFFRLLLCNEGVWGQFSQVHCARAYGGPTCRISSKSARVGVLQNSSLHHWSLGTRDVLHAVDCLFWLSSQSWYSFTGRSTRNGWTIVRVYYNVDRATSVWCGKWLDFLTAWEGRVLESLSYITITT